MIIIGGGIAGLVAAFELRRQGHEPLVLEAQHRVGGRVRTIRDFAPGLYAEAGAMRIPRVHDLTLAYCDLFGLEMRPFVMGNPKTLVHIDGQRMTTAEADEAPEKLPFDLADHEKGKTWTQLWNEATQRVPRPVRAGWPESLDSLLLNSYDQYSIREFLVMRGFSEGAIELYGVMSFRESNMNAAVVEQLREIVGKSFEDMQEIAGGMDQLPRAFYENLKPYVRFGAEVTSIEQDPDSVTVHYKGPAGRHVGHRRLRDLRHPVLGTARDRDPGHGLLAAEAEGDPRAQLQRLGQDPLPDAAPLLGVGGRDRRRHDGHRPADSAHLLPVVLQSGRRARHAPRFVHVGPGRAALGRHGRRGRDRAGARGCRADPSVDHEGVRGRRGPELVRRPVGRGAFALFEPEQQTRLQESIVAPEGRIHFAGEHTSLYHAWIQGALESGIRAAKEIHEMPVSAARARLAARTRT